MKNETRGEKIIRFITEYCVTPEGEHVGKPLQLADFQKKFILDVYDNPEGTRRAYLSIARKNGKSGLIAALLLAHIIGPERVLNSQIVSGARSRDQAALLSTKHYLLMAQRHMVCHQFSLFWMKSDRFVGHKMTLLMLLQRLKALIKHLF